MATMLGRISVCFSSSSCSAFLSMGKKGGQILDCRSLSRIVDDVNITAVLRILPHRYDL